MLEGAAALGSLLLDALRSLRLTRGNRVVIAKALGLLYRELHALVVNGDTILRMLSSHNRGKTVDLDALGRLLEDQHVILRRINGALGERKVKTALSILAPQLTPLPVLLDGKRLRIELLRQRVELGRRRFEIVPPAWLGRGFSRDPRAVGFPANRSIELSRRELAKIRAQVVELRKFIVENFEVHEVL